MSDFGHLPTIGSPGSAATGTRRHAGERQRIEGDIGDLLDAAQHRSPSTASSFQLRRGRGKQDGKDIVARRVHVENDAFHFMPDPGTVFAREGTPDRARSPG
jgi:hypothetical protein